MEDHEVDAYLSRCVKNWAAHNSAPENGRELLLRAARIQPEIFDSHRIFSINQLFKSIFYNQPIVEPDPDWLFVPFTQSRLWSFHVATTRLST